MAKLLSAALAAGLLSNAVPMEARAEAAAVSIANPYRGCICLNGNAVIIADGAGAGLTKFYADTNANGVLDEGELPIEFSNEDGSLEDGYNLSGTYVYGGSMTDSYNGDIKITMIGGSLYYIGGTFTEEVIGNFSFHMTGGTLTEVTSAAMAPLKGNVNIVIGGNAVVSGSVYGGGLNSNVEIGGSVNIVIEGNAVVGSNGSNDGVYAGGQQPDNVIAGTSTITVKGGTVKGVVRSDLFDTVFRQAVTVDIQGGSILGSVWGIFCSGSQAPSVRVKVSGGTIAYTVFGVANNTASTVISVSGGEIKGQIVGAYSGKTGTVSIEITGGSVGGSIMGRAVPGNVTDESWQKGSIIISGGSFQNRIMLRNGGVLASMEVSEIRIEGSPVFGESGSILLRSGEAVTQTGSLTNGGIRIDVGNVSQEGTLIVKPATGGVVLKPEDFMLLNVGAGMGLVFGTAQGTGSNLYLGTKSEHTHEWGSWSIMTEPTLTAAGTAERVCNLDNTHKDEKELPVLTDTTVWTVGERVEPGETTAGSQLYTSVYGNVTIVLPATGAGQNPGDNTGSTGDNTGNTTGGTGDNTGGNTGGTQGAIQKEVERKENVPEVSLPIDAQELGNMLLTEAEKSQVAGGSNIQILLTVSDAGDSVSEEERESVNAVLGERVIGQYLDISLFKVVDGSQNRITETTGKIRITIVVPENLRNEARSYAIIRVHNGETLVLEDLDSDADTITIETDRFSTYVIVYQDVAEAAANDSAQNTTAAANQAPPKDNEPKTGDSTQKKITIYATLAMVSGLGYLMLYFADESHGMTEEEKRALTARLIRWAQRGGQLRRLFALTVIFAVLLYYHSIGKKRSMEQTGREMQPARHGTAGGIQRNIV